jgi:DNA-binding NarL/FixJ family response regulator
MKSVLLIEDLPHVADWINQAIRLAFNHTNVVTAKTLAEGHTAIDHHTFDLALIDIGLPDGSGMDLLDRLRAEQPDCLNVMSTIFDDDQHVFTALRKGAKGYILKDQSKHQLGQMLHGITQGHYPISPAIANKLLHFFQPVKLPSKLTNRETEVLTLVAKGFSVPKVSELLSIKSSTCYGYVKDIYRKLNINSRSEATLEATKLGLISPNAD